MTLATYDADGRLAKNIDGNENEIALDYTSATAGCDTCSGGSTDQPSVIEFPTFTRQIKYDKGIKGGRSKLINLRINH